MYRTWVICRHTFFEAIAQPIFSLLLGIAALIVLVFSVLPFFTLGEDTVMYKSVGLDTILLLVLLSTLFATSKSIHEEIEDRTMLTLMSKPVSRLQVLLGKYLGLIGAAGMGIFVLGALLMICTYYRIPSDYQINGVSIDEREAAQLWDFRLGHLAGLVPSLLLMWMMVSTLAALSVAISTRYSLVVNLPVVILLYLAGNLMRFVPDAVEGTNVVISGIAWLASLLLPFLQVFDLQKWTVYGQIGFGTDNGELLHSATPLKLIWQNTGLAALYAVTYITAALSAGMLIFKNRELGGAEG